MAATNGITLRKNITYLLQYLIKEKKFLNIVIDILKKSNCALFFFLSFALLKGVICFIADVRCSSARLQLFIAVRKAEFGCHYPVTSGPSQVL